MQPGSLIFLVIVAVWLVYLVQHWIRRREHVATARSVDRFSEAMRVLERREALPATRVAEPHPSSYVVRPPAARPALVVKRAPAVSRAVEPVADDAFDGGSSSLRPVRLVGGLVTVLALVGLPVMAVLSLRHVLPWFSVAVAAVAFVAGLVVLRLVTAREQAARRAARSAARRRARDRDRAEVSSGGAVRSSSAPRSRRDDRSDDRSADRSDDAGEELVSVPAEVAEAPVSPIERESTVPVPVAAPAARRTQADDEVFDLSQGSAGTAWSPVFVPPPTYTLKDAAPRPAAPPAAVTPVPSNVPVPIEVEDDELERLMAARQLRIG